MDSENNFPIPTDVELENLRAQIADSNRSAEYAKLKRDLAEIVSTTVNTPNEVEGVMQIPDTEKVLKTKRDKSQFFELLIERVRGMFSVRPIIGNIIALLIVGVSLYFIFTEVHLSKTYQGFLSIGIEIFAAIQILKSSTRGLLLPFLALVIGTVASHTFSKHHLIFHFDKTFFEYLMVVGIIGLGISVLTID